jgi:hypothetical protein
MWAWVKSPMCGKPNHVRSIKCNSLIHFSSKWLYNWPKVTKIIVYHSEHTTKKMGILAMVYDPKSTIQMFIYVSCMSQILKDYIWIQLRFKDIMNL